MYPKAHYPAGFKMPSIPKFTRMTPLELYLKFYLQFIKIYDVGEAKLANSFHLTLHRVCSWIDIVKEFVVQYKKKEEL